MDTAPSSWCYRFPDVSFGRVMFGETPLFLRRRTGLRLGGGWQEATFIVNIECILGEPVAWNYSI